MAQELMEKHLGHMSVKFEKGRDHIAYDLSYVVDVVNPNSASEFMAVHGPVCTSELEKQVRKHVAQSFGDDRSLHSWHRYDVNVGNFRTSLKDGPAWNSVQYRATCRLSGKGECIIEPAALIPRNQLHERLPWERSSLCTILLYD